MGEPLTEPRARRTWLDELFPRGPITSHTFELGDFIEPTSDQRVSLADEIEQTGHALTAKDLAGLLNVSAVTIFKQAKAGRIPSFRIGTLVRFMPTKVADWLRRQ